MHSRLKVYCRWIYAYAIEHVLLALWMAAQVILFVLAFNSYLHNERLLLAREAMGRYTLPLAKASTRLIALNSSLVLIPCCKFLVNAIGRIFTLAAPRSFRNIHVAVAMGITFFSFLHVTSHMVNFVSMSKGPSSRTSLYRLVWLHGTGITGVVLVVVLFFIFSTSDTRIRNFFHEFFQYCHFLWIAFFGIASFHGAFCFIRLANPAQCVFPTFFIWWLPSAGLYVADRILRWNGIAKHRASIYRVIVHPSEVIEVLFFIQKFAFHPGQFLYLNVPSISKWQWHPFSITSCPLPSTKSNVCSIHIRMTGDWTRQLGMRCGASLQHRVPNAVFKGRGDLIEVVDAFPQVRIDGPYGSFCKNIYHFRTIVLVGAGIGQTPFTSLLRFLHYEYQAVPKFSIQRVYFYGIARDTHAFEWFYELLRDIEHDNCSSFFIPFLTITKQFDHIQAAHIHTNDLEGISDAITKLKTPTRYGKFPYKIILNELHALYREERVGLFYCGPSELGKKIQWESFKYSNLCYHCEEF